MDEERRRILRMMAEGTISVEECDELLRALSNRREKKVEKEVEASKGKRPVWPYVLLIILATLAVFPLLAVFGHDFRSTFMGFNPYVRHFVFWPPSLVLVPRLTGLLSVLLFAFWIWMIVDCISRLPCDFRLLFTTQHKYEKWIWLAIVVLTGWLGTLAYFIVIRQPARKIALGSSYEPTNKSDQSEALFRPSPRARSLWPFVLLIILLAIAVPLILLLLRPVTGVFSYHMVPLRGIALKPLVLIGPGAVLLFAGTVFWIWMIIDCLARDYREFGTLITSDKSADKLLWLLVVLFTFIIGALAYHISIRRRQGKK